MVPRVMAAELQPNISIAKCELIRDLNHEPQFLIDRPTSLNGALQASYEGTPEAGKPFTVNITYPEVGAAKTANHAVKALRLKKHQVVYQELRNFQLTPGSDAATVAFTPGHSVDLGASTVYAG